MSGTKAGETGGPAFPFTERDGNGEHYHSHGGMTLRDWFAGQALAGMLASEGDEGGYQPDVAADRAYRVADAMLAARLAKTGER